MFIDFWFFQAGKNFTYAFPCKAVNLPQRREEAREALKIPAWKKKQFKNMPCGIGYKLIGYLLVVKPARAVLSIYYFFTSILFVKSDELGMRNILLSP